MPREVSIPTLRRRIDRIDDRLLQLLNERSALALRIGYAYQQATDWHERVPPMVASG